MRLLILSMLGMGTMLLCVLGFAGALPGGDGIAAQRTLPDGTQLLVTQTHGTADLGYEVGFYVKSPNSHWEWCYLHHEDTKWRNGRIDYDEASGTATIWKGSTLRGRMTFPSKNWERPDVPEWLSNAPHKMKEPPFQLAELAQ